MFGIDQEYLRKFATLITLAAAVTAVGIRIAVYEVRQADLQADVVEIKRQVAFLDSVALSRSELIRYNSKEIDRLRVAVDELRENR